jgi:type II secretory pathway pseudopilin PulG
MKFKKGDTLIEVAIAIGIFSMVAITVVSVVNTSTSSAQSTLEITVAREEIDAQAEALRFIHNSATIGEDTNTSSALSNNTGYAAIWKKITDLATTNAEALVYDVPTTCSQLYSTNALKGVHAFILNPRQISTKDPSKIVFDITSNSSKFKSPSTYPRLVYNSTDVAEGPSNSMYAQGTGNTLYAAEGIFIVPFKDVGSYVVVGKNGTKKSAYYDFYIRTCWFSPGADKPSTISTVVRLYNQDAV